MTTKQRRLDDIKQKITDDNVTPELAAQATQVVFGEGSPDAELLFIGEAPGKQEDLQGRPFIGAAGKFLDEMLEMVGLKRSQVYITNIVKYRPPNNRDPLPEEKKAFLPYLQTQLEIIQPKVVVTLGRHSLNCFLPDFQISQCHGQPKRIRVNLHTKAAAMSAEVPQPTAESTNGFQMVLLPLFHPAAALYNNSMRQTLIDDFAKVPAILAQTT